jgi:polysaccharide chain length determinant protein (PEP-CTERM system associated)
MRDELETSAPDEPFVLRAVAILRRRAMLAFALFALALVAGVAVAVTLPDLFRASAVVLVERQLPESVVRPSASGELESRLHVIRQEILSRARLTELINRYDLYPDVRHTDMDRAIEQVRRDIEIELTGPEQVSGRTKTVAFNLSFTGARRESVAEVTNAIAAFYVNQNTQMRSEEAARATQFLRTQIEAAKTQMDRDEQQVKAYTSRHVGELPQQVDVNLATLERLNTQLRINSERQLRTLEQRDRLYELPAPVLPPQPPPVSAEDARLRALKRDLAQLDGFPDKHPDVRRLKDAIATLEAEIRAGGAAVPAPEPAPKSGDAPSGRARTVASLDAELQTLKSEEARLRGDIAAMEQRLEAVPYRQSEFALLSRDHQATRDQYESLLKRYEEARVAQNMETENQGERFRVLESAVPPPGPTAPNRPRLLLMSLCLAALIAVLGVLAVEQIDTTFHSVDDVRQFTTLPVLAAIPRLQPAAGPQWLRLAVITASMLAGFVLVGTVSVHVARDNEPLVRLLVRGG